MIKLEVPGAVAAWLGCARPQGCWYGLAVFMAKPRLPELKTSLLASNGSILAALESCYEASLLANTLSVALPPLLVLLLMAYCKAYCPPTLSTSS